MTNSIQTLTVKDLDLRNFNTDKKTGEIKSVSSEKCQVATNIPFSQFVLSKEPGRRSRSVPYSGHQILNAIQHYVKERTGIDNTFGNIVVYRDTLSHPGYVSRITPETQGQKILLPDTPISELVFERFIGTIDLLENNESNMRLAVKYEADKLELALGTNIKICQNFNIFGGKRIVSQRNLTYDMLIETTKEWLDGIEEHYQSDLTLINNLGNRRISVNERYQYLGEMIELYQENKAVLPVTDITALAANIVEKREINNLWDLTQAGTEVLRFDNNSGNSILETIESWNKFMVSKL